MTNVYAYPRHIRFSTTQAQQINDAIMNHTKAVLYFTPEDFIGEGPNYMVVHLNKTQDMKLTNALKQNKPQIVKNTHE